MVILVSWASCKSSSVPCTLNHSSGAGEYRAWGKSHHYSITKFHHSVKMHTHLSSLIDVNLALTVTSSNMVASRCPVKFREAHVQCLTQNGDLRKDEEVLVAPISTPLHGTNLSVRVDVPEVKSTLTIHTSKDCWVCGAPLYIIHILTVVLK